MKQISIWILISIIAVEVLAMSILTHAGRAFNWAWAALGIALYTAVGTLFAALMWTTGGSDLAFSNAVWNAGTVVVAALIAVSYFREQLSWYTWGGIALAVVAIILLGYGEYRN